MVLGLTDNFYNRSEQWVKITLEPIPVFTREKQNNKQIRIFPPSISSNLTPGARLINPYLRDAFCLFSWNCQGLGQEYEGLSSYRGSGDEWRGVIIEMRLLILLLSLAAVVSAANGMRLGTSLLSQSIPSLSFPFRIAPHSELLLRPKTKKFLQLFLVCFSRSFNNICNCLVIEVW